MAALVARGARTVRARVRRTRDEWRALDDQLVAARLGAVLFVLAGVVVVVLHALPHEFGAPEVSLAVATLGAALGVAALRMPWGDWPVDAQLAFPLVGFALTAAGAHGEPRTGTAAVVAAMTALFVITGFAQRPGRCLLLAPLAALAMVLAVPSEMAPAPGLQLVLEVAVSVASGEAVSLVMRRQRRAERRIRALLDAVRTMSALDDPRVAPARLADLVVDILDADAAVVLLRDAPGSTRMVNRARAGHPALAACVPSTLRANDGPCARALAEHEVVVIDSARGFVTPSGAPVPSLAVLPIAARHSSYGCVLVLWNRPAARFARSTRDAAELLAQEAGRMAARLSRQARLTEQARTDALTTLANRRTYTEALARLAPGDAVVVIDLDHFKRVNDTFGHAAGDTTLQALADALRAVARQGDTMARYGGEEFALVLPGAGAAGARALLMRLRTAWSARNALTTFSAGVAIHEAGAAPHHTLRRADAALYAAKRAGRDRDHVAPPGEIDVRDLRDGSVPAPARA